MSDARTVQLLTAEEFAALPDDGRRTELIEGEVVELTPTSGEHGYYSGRVQFALLKWLDEHPVGHCLTNDVGVIVGRDRDTVLAPDAAVYLKTTLPDPRVSGFMAVIPELVVEVVSSNDRPGEVMKKVGRWLEAGVLLAWVVWPRNEQVTVFGPDGEIAQLNREDTLTCESLLPGFALPIEKVFSA